MKSRIISLILSALLLLCVFSGCAANGAATATPAATSEATAAPAEPTAAPTAAADVLTLYDHAYIATLTGGFTDTLEANAKAEELTVEQFRTLCEKSATDMTEAELTKMNHIREKQLKPTSETLLQKVITLYDMNKYLSGEYKTPRGFTSICADVKQYVTTEDMLYGLRLDYEGTYFTLDENFAVIRFFAQNADELTIPLSPNNGGTCEDPYPFGGAGFTTGTKGRLGSPEWTLDGFFVTDEGAQLFEVQKDGTEILRGVYSAEAGQFVSPEGYKFDREPLLAEK